MAKSKHPPKKAPAKRKAAQASKTIGQDWLFLPALKNAVVKTFNQHALAMRLSSKSIIKTPASTLMALMAIGVALSLPIALHAFLKNIDQLTSQIQYRGALTLYLDKNITEQEVHTLQQQLQERFTVIQAAEFISKEAALAEFKANADVEDILNLLPSNPLHPMLALEMNSNQVPIEEAKQLKLLIEEYPAVISTDLDYAWVEKLHTVVNFGKTLANSLSLMIGIGIIFIIANIIKMSLTERRAELEVFNLIGATPSFIRRPYLYHGLSYGGLGALIALGIISVATWFFERPVTDLSHLFEGIFAIAPLSVSEIGRIVLYCGLLGGVGAWMAFYQHQKTVS